MATATVTTVDTKARAESINSLKTLDAVTVEFLKIKDGNESLRSEFTNINATTSNSRKILRQHEAYNKHLRRETERCVDAANSNLRTVEEATSNSASALKIKGLISNALALDSDRSKADIEALRQKTASLVTRLGLASSGTLVTALPNPQQKQEILDVVGKPRNPSGYTFNQLFQTICNQGDDHRTSVLETERLEGDLERQKQEIANLNQSLGVLRRDEKVLKNKIEGQEEEIQQISDEWKEAFDDCQELESAKKKLQGECDQLRESYEELQSQLVAKDEEIQKLTNNINGTANEAKAARVEAEHQRDEAVANVERLTIARDEAIRGRQEAVAAEGEVREELEQTTTREHEGQNALRERLDAKSSEVRAALGQVEAQKAQVERQTTINSKLQVVFKKAIGEAYGNEMLLKEDLHGALDLDRLVELNLRRLKPASYEARSGGRFLHDMGRIFLSWEYNVRPKMSRFCYLVDRTKSAMDAEMVRQELSLLYTTFFDIAQAASVDFVAWVHSILESIMHQCWENQWESLFTTACAMYTKSISLMQDDIAWKTLQARFPLDGGECPGILPTTALLRLGAALCDQDEEKSRGVSLNSYRLYAEHATEEIMWSMSEDLDQEKYCDETIPELALRYFEAMRPDDYYLFQLPSECKRYKIIVYYQVDEPKSFHAWSKAYSTARCVYVARKNRNDVDDGENKYHEYFGPIDFIDFVMRQNRYLPDSPDIFLRTPVFEDMTFGPLPLTGRVNDFFKKHFGRQITHALAEYMKTTRLALPEEIEAELSSMNVHGTLSDRDILRTSAARVKPVTMIGAERDILEEAEEETRRTFTGFQQPQNLAERRPARPASRAPMTQRLPNVSGEPSQAPMRQRLPNVDDRT